MSFEINETDLDLEDLETILSVLQDVEDSRKVRAKQLANFFDTLIRGSYE